MDAITVTYNSGPTLQNLLRCGPLRAGFDQVIVVDAGSRDDSAEIAEQLGATVLRRRAPSGYGACVNSGVALTRGESFAVLNPDILLEDPGVPAKLERWFEDERVGCVAPSLRLPDGRLQDSARTFPTPLDLVARRGSVKDRGAVRTTGPVPWVVGAFMVLRRRAFDLVGGFDEAYFLYFEDVDLCWRMKQRGFATVLDHETTAYHDHQGASRAPLWHRSTRAHVRSAFRFYKRNPRFILARHASSVRLS